VAVTDEVRRPPLCQVGGVTMWGPSDAAGRETDRMGPPTGHDADLATLVAQLSTDEAVLARTRAHWLNRQAAAEGTFAGILRDLAERGRPVLVHLHNGRLHRGAATVVGADFVVIRTAGDRDVAVTFTAIASVRTLPGEPATTGDRFLPATTTLAEMLSALGEERARILVMGLDARQAIAGELRAVGRDVLTIRLGGEGGTAYVALDSLAEISLVESG
jgi:hypothetical protein